MMGRICCFLLEPTGRVQIYLRRYIEGACPVTKGGYHTAAFRIEDEPAEMDARGFISNGIKPGPPAEDPRWPRTCACGYAFPELAERQRFAELIYQRSDTGEEMLLRDAPAGAMWYAWWLDDLYMPQGEHNLVVKTPGGEWTIDGQASNCQMPEDVAQEHHHCWIRHGDPPNVTVDKQGGPTCQAGAGSIQCGDYHGFLRNGFLED